MSLPIHAPSSFFAGDTVKWLEFVPNYLPAEGWSLVVDFTNAVNHYAVASEGFDAGSHLVHITSNISGGFSAGDYRMGIAAVHTGGERYTLQSSDITVRPSLGSSTDARSHVKKTLDAIEAWIESRSPGVAEYSVAGRSMKYWAMEELIAHHNRYRRLYQQEKNADRLASGRKPRRRLLIRMPSS